MNYNMINHEYMDVEDDDVRIINNEQMINDDEFADDDVRIINNEQMINDDVRVINNEQMINDIIDDLLITNPYNNNPYTQQDPYNRFLDEVSEMYELNPEFVNELNPEFVNELNELNELNALING